MGHVQRECADHLRLAAGDDLEGGGVACNGHRGVLELARELELVTVPGDELLRQDPPRFHQLTLEGGLPYSCRRLRRRRLGIAGRPAPALVASLRLCRTVALLLHLLLVLTDRRRRRAERAFVRGSGGRGGDDASLHRGPSRARTTARPRPWPGRLGRLRLELLGNEEECAPNVALEQAVDLLGDLIESARDLMVATRHVHHRRAYGVAFAPVERVDLADPVDERLGVADELADEPQLDADVRDFVQALLQPFRALLYLLLRAAPHPNLAPVAVCHPVATMATLDAFRRSVVGGEVLVNEARLLVEDPALSNHAA
mmetsp:Transcript_68563/g.190815  ORF Transcript_68563/g.190815 Transcript_68563/m.190815 type:complete len:315 (+) Transcript_68563:234-1178(+)